MCRIAHQLISKRDTEYSIRFCFYQCTYRWDTKGFRNLDSPHRTGLSLPKCRIQESELSSLGEILTARSKGIFSLIYLNFVFIAQKADLE